MDSLSSVPVVHDSPIIMTPALFMLVGLCIGTALHHLIIYLRRRGDTVYLLFSVLCGLVAGYAYLSQSVYTSTSVTAFVTLAKVQVVLVLLFNALFLCFVGLYLYERIPWTFRVLAGACMALLVPHLLSRFGILFGDVQGIADGFQPWGERVTVVEGAPGLGRAVYFLVNASAYIAILVHCIWQYWRGNRQRALMLGLAVALFLLFTVNDLLVGLNAIKGMYLAEFAVVALVLAMSLDLSSRLREAALRMTEDKYYRLLEGIQNEYCIHLADTDGVITYMSPSSREVLGGAPETFVGRSWRSFLGRTEAAEAFEAAGRACGDGVTPSPFEVWMGRQDSSERCLEVHLWPVVNEHGDVTAIEGVSKDVTKRKHAEAVLADATEAMRKANVRLEERVQERTAELEAANRYLREEVEERERAQDALWRLAIVIEQASETVLITDPEARIEYVNPAFTELTGYTLEEVQGKTPGILKSGEHDVTFYQDLWRTITGGEVWKGTFVNKKKDGTVYQEQGTVSPVRDESGAITHYVSVRRDTTREADLEAQLRQAQKMEAIGTLAGGIAHDFNNMLSPILGYADLARNAVPEGSDAYSFLTRIGNAGERARDLVKQILAFSRQTDQERRPVRLQEVVGEALRLLRSSLPASIEIVQEVDPDCPPILANESQVHQMVMNLATNAFHAMEATGGVLTVVLEPVSVDADRAAARVDLVPGLYVCLTVRDTGHGMDSQTLERVFEPYFTTKEEGKGTGLGLATVHGIVKSHNGGVYVYSERGVGTEFKVFLPLPEEAQIEEGPEIAAPERGHGELVMLVDDDPSVLEVAREILMQLGYQVTAYPGPRQAIEAFSAAPAAVDVAVVDRTMPEMDGFELAKALRGIRPALPVILTTGFHSGEVSRQARALGICSVVSKPAHPHELGHAIRTALDEGRELSEE